MREAVTMLVDRPICVDECFAALECQMSARACLAALQRRQLAWEREATHPHNTITNKPEGSSLLVSYALLQPFVCRGLLAGRLAVVCVVLRCMRCIAGRGSAVAAWSASPCCCGLQGPGETHAAPAEAGRQRQLDCRYVVRRRRRYNDIADLTARLFLVYLTHVDVFVRFCTSILSVS